MISIHNSKVEQAIALYKTELDAHEKKAIKGINKLILSKHYFGDELKYLYSIRIYLKYFVTANSEKLYNWISFFNKIIPGCIIESPIKNDFRNDIISALDYKKLRSDFLPSYFNILGIKSCVYCNSMLTVSIENEQGKTRARLQADHFHPKARYPFLSISLYNLYPTCSPCNNIKSENEIQFELFSSDIYRTQSSDYSFKVIRAGIAKYLVNKNINDLDFDFEEPIVSSPSKTFQELFDIKGIYNTQKDLVEELIIKARIYNKPYKKFLMDSFPTLFNNSNLSNRVLIGNYTERGDIHKRPMAKFTQDIARQLKLIE